MSYSAHCYVFIAAREVVAPMLVDDEGFDAADQDVYLHAASRGAAMSAALRDLAVARAPQALALFRRPWSANAWGGYSLGDSERLIDVLVDGDLASALAATESLLTSCRSEPDAMATILASNFPVEIQLGTLSADLRAAVSTSRQASAEAACANFKRQHEEQDLHPSALLAWLEAFASILRLARVRDAAVVHAAWF